MQQEKLLRGRIDMDQKQWLLLCQKSNMLPVLYRCPSTGYRVQGFAADEAAEPNPNGDLTVLCSMCQKMHLVNPTSGQVSGETGKQR